MKLRDTLERLVWTFVAAFLTALLGSPVLLDVIGAVADVTIEVDAFGAAVIAASFAGLTAVANYVLLIARWRLSVLPGPGEGLPGLPTNDTVNIAARLGERGAGQLVTILVVIALVLVILWLLGFQVRIG